MRSLSLGHRVFHRLPVLAEREQIGAHERQLAVEKVAAVAIVGGTADALHFDDDVLVGGGLGVHVERADAGDGILQSFFDQSHFSQPPRLSKDPG